MEGERYSLSDPRTMSSEEKQQRREMLVNANVVKVDKGIIQSTPKMSARKVAEKWWDDNVSEPKFYPTEIGEVEINRNSIENSLAHRYGQKKLDAITSLVEGFENAVYLGTMEDSTRQEGVLNHYFAYPIEYDGELNYVFCRAMQDANKNSLYVHEVFLADNITKGNTLQTAAFQPHGGISLYRDILANILLADKGSEESSDTQENSAKAQYSLQGNSLTEEEQRIADEAKANGTFDASNPDIRYSLATDLNAEVSEGEANPIAEKEVVNVIVDSSEIKLPTNRAEALDVVSKMKRPFINHDQNKEIIVSNKAVRHVATQDKMHKFVDVRCLGVIDKIIENAVKIGNIDVAPDKIETTHKVEVYYCPVKIDDTKYSVRILVRQLKNKGRIMEDFRMYDLAAKDKKSDVSSQGTGNESLTPLLTSDFAYKVKDLIHNSKEQDKKLLGISNKTKFSLQGGRSIADKYEKKVNTKGKGGAMHLSKFNFMEAWQD